MSKHAHAGSYGKIYTFLHCVQLQYIIFNYKFGSYSMFFLFIRQWRYYVHILEPVSLRYICAQEGLPSITSAAHATPSSESPSFSRIASIALSIILRDSEPSRRLRALCRLRELAMISLINPMVSLTKSAIVVRPCPAEMRHTLHQSLPLVLAGAERVRTRLPFSTCSSMTSY